MRKIEEEIYTAVLHLSPVSGSNTVVAPNKMGGVACWLHGNKVFESWVDKRGKRHCSVDDCGWATSTTRSRVNACLDGWGASWRLRGRACDRVEDRDGTKVPVSSMPVSSDYVEKALKKARGEKTSE